MHFHYCPMCGAELSHRILGDEGAVPWCDACDRPWFDMFSSCVIILVTNEKHEVALIQQDFPPSPYRKLVAGFIKPGETAEECAAREVEEEIGIRVKKLKLTRTVWFGKRNQLMLCFMALAENTDFHLSEAEVNSAEWVPAEQAAALVHPYDPQSASSVLVADYLKEIKENGFETGF